MISICVADNSYKAIFLLLKLFLLYFLVVKEITYMMSKILYND